MYNNYPQVQLPFYNSMPNSYSQIVASSVPVYPPTFQTQGISGINQIPQQSIPPQNFQMNPNQPQTAQPTPMVVNPIAAPITSAMRIQAAKSSRISWRNVHDLDIEALKKSNDIETLESYLPNLLDSIVTQEEYEKLKPEALVNLLQICQMSLQYFDYTQDYLENLSNETQDEINKVYKKVEEDKKILKKSKKEIEKMKSEIEIKKEAIKKYKNFLKQRPQYKCHICINKFFANEDYLDAHIKRRHAHVLPMNANHPNFAVMQNMVFAQQLQQERLEFERQQKLLLKNEKFQKDDVIDKLELILQKNRQEQAELQLEMQRRLRDIESQQNEVINKKQQENEFQRQQIVDLMKNMNKIHDEITNLKYREVVVQQSSQNEQRESQLQELYRKQNELIENNQKLKLQQIALETQKEKKLLEENQKLQQLKKKNSLRSDQLNNNDDLIKQLIGDDSYSKIAQNNNNHRQKVPSEIKQVTKYISEIRGSKNGNQIDKETIEELDGIYLGNPDKINQQKQQNEKQQQPNKFNSIASNMILQGHPVYNQKQNTKEEEEDISEEGEIQDDFYNSEDEEQNSYESNENDISKDKEFNNQCEEEKETIELNLKQKSQTDKTKSLEQLDEQINKKLREQGINQPIQNLQNLPNKQVETILEQVRNPDKVPQNKLLKNDDFDDDFEQSKGNNQGINQSGKGVLHSSRKNQQLEESSQNYDESGYYNGSKGRTYELQANPTSLNKQLQQFGDSYTETLYQNKNQKKFAYEDSDEF